MLVNVCRLKQDGSVSLGYPRKDKSIRIHVPGGREVIVPFHKKSPPRYDRGLLLEARPETVGGKKVLAARAGYEKVLVIVDVGALNFPDATSSNFKLEKAWPGAETLGDAWVQIGPRKSPIQAQGMWVSRGEIVTVADMHSQYIELSWDGVDMVTHPADPLRFARALVARARRLVTEVEWRDLRDRNQMLGWTKYAVGAVGHGVVWPDDLERLLDQR